jgi:ABC-type dipeptide/oligopeptide/nickel transport system permease component
MQYLVRRLISSIVTLALVTVVVFSLIHLIPGDPASIILGLRATPQSVHELRHTLGLDRPLLVQYLIFLGNLVHGNLGDSVTFREPVSDLVLARLQATLFLVLYSAVISIVVAVPVAVIAALRRDKVSDYSIRLVLLVAVSLPSFWIGTLLIYQFSLKLGWFPAAGYGSNFTEHLSSLLLPAVTLSLWQFALIGRNLRSTLIDVIQLPYIDFARMKGLKPSTVLVRHVLRTSLSSTVTIIGINISFLVAGAVVVENVFSIPGSGQLLVNAVFARDYPVVQGVTLVYAVLVILINLATDLMYPVLDPRAVLE